MKNIDQQAIDYAQKWYTEESEYLIARLGFKAGVEFAERWIPVTEELPKHNENVLIKYKNMIFDEMLVDICDAWEARFIEEYNVEFWRPIDLK